MSGHGVARSLAELDFNRSASRVARPERFKQWVHMTVVDPAVALMVNFSSVSVAGLAPEPQLTVILFERDVRGSWRRFPAEQCRVPLGRAELRFGDNSSALVADRYTLEISVPEIDARASLVLVAQSQASSLVNVRLSDDATFSWTVVPRLTARGTITCRGRHHAIVDAPAYRDRNWGCFSFGDVTWDWGYAVPNEPAAQYAVVFARVMNRARTRVLEQDVLVWRGEALLAAFRDHEVTLRGAGRVRAPAVTLPPSLSLCRPGTATDVPATLAVTATSARGHVELDFSSEQTARLIVPNDGRPGTSLIHETLGACRVTARVEGHDVRFDGRGFLECVDG